MAGCRLFSYGFGNYGIALSGIAFGSSLIFRLIPRMLHTSILLLLLIKQMRSAKPGAGKCSS